MWSIQLSNNGACTLPYAWKSMAKCEILLWFHSVYWLLAHLDDRPFYQKGTPLTDEKKVSQKLAFRQIQYNFFYINTLLENYKRRSLYWIGLIHCLPLALRPSEVFLPSCESFTNTKLMKMAKNDVDHEFIWSVFEK